MVDIALMWFNFLLDCCSSKLDFSVLFSKFQGIIHFSCLIAADGATLKVIFSIDGIYNMQFLCLEKTKYKVCDLHAIIKNWTFLEGLTWKTRIWLTTHLRWYCLTRDHKRLIWIFRPQSKDWYLDTINTGWCSPY